MALVRKMGLKEGFGAFLGRGLKETSQELGGMALECAIHVKGMAVPAHDPRAFNSLSVGYGTSNRGACHLQGFSHIFERNVSMKEWGFDREIDIERSKPWGPFHPHSKSENLWPKAKI